jgi:hypothetical protein
MNITYQHGNYKAEYNAEQGVVIRELNGNLVRKAKHWGDALKAVDELNELDQKIKAYYAQPAEVLNRDFAAQADENRARGWTND